MGAVKEGKKVIHNGVIGLIVFRCSYVVLQSINPDLVTLRALRLSYVQRDLLAKILGEERAGAM